MGLRAVFRAHEAGQDLSSARIGKGQTVRGEVRETTGGEGDQVPEEEEAPSYSAVIRAKETSDLYKSWTDDSHDLNLQKKEKKKKEEDLITWNLLTDSSRLL